MEISIKYVKDNQNLNKERLVLEVLEDCDIGNFVILNTLTVDNGPSSILKNSYWFPDKHVQKGDLVVLYTKHGKSSEKERSNGSKTHFFYWGLNESTWEIGKHCCVIIRVDNWDYKIL